MYEKNFENPEFTNKGRPTTLTQWAMKPTCFAQINTKIPPLSLEIIIYTGTTPGPP